MVNKKGGKGGTRGGGRGGGGRKPKPQHEALREPQLPPQDRVDAVRPLWESLSHEERVALLTIDVDTLRQRTRIMAEALKQQQQQAQSQQTLQQQSQSQADGSDECMEDATVHETSYEAILDEGIHRLQERGTWKLWTWTSESSFYDADSFRNYITEKHIREDLRKFLPREDTKAPEKPAEAAFRQRMSALLQKVQQSTRQAQEEGTGAPSARAYKRRHGGSSGDSSLQGARDANVELINVMLEALEKEHECLYQSLLQPIIAFVSLVAPDASRDAAAKGELAFEDLDKMAPEHAAAIVEWLTEKVDSLSSKLKADPKDEEEPEEEEEDNMGDVDLWAVVDEGKALTVNAKWLQHLQDRLLGEEGHPRKARGGEDPHRNGLVLEWVYGSIVSTAEKARDGAKRMLGGWIPHAADAHHTLLRALEEYWLWEVRGRQAKDLMSEMLKSRIEAQELAKHYDIAPIPPKPPTELAVAGAGVTSGEDGLGAGPNSEDALVSSSTSTTLLAAGGSAGAGAAVTGSPQGAPLPDHVVVAMLRREALLTKAKLHHLLFEHLQQDKMVRSLKAQLRQGEPEFERLKRELDEVKHQHRGLDGTYRSAAEMERHRAQLADAAIEEQLEVQTAFREQGARLQSIYDKRQRAEYEMSKREVEIKQLQGWKGTVESLVDKFVEVLQSMGLGHTLGLHAQPQARSSTATPLVAVAEAGTQALLRRTMSSSSSAAGAGQGVGEGADTAGLSSRGDGARPEAGLADGDQPQAATTPERGGDGDAAGSSERPLASAAVAGSGACDGQGSVCEPEAAAPDGVAGGEAADGACTFGSAAADGVEAGGDANAVRLAAPAAPAPPEASEPELELLPTPQQSMQLAKLRTHFHKDVRKQLYGDAEDKMFFEWLKTEVKVVEKRLEESRVALQHLEMQLINVACDDPGAVIGMQMALPILQERLDAKALEHAAQRAKMAESEIIKMELEQQAREAAERERRLKAKQSKKDKVRSEREKMAAEKAAEKAAEDERRAEEVARQRQAEEAERQRRLQQMEELRRAEEEYIEQRRRELLSDENGYWRRRVDAEARVAGAAGTLMDASEAPSTPPQQTEATPVDASSSLTSVSAALSQQEEDLEDDAFVSAKRRRRREGEASPPSAAPPPPPAAAPRSTAGAATAATGSVGHTPGTTGGASRVDNPTASPAPRLDRSGSSGTAAASTTGHVQGQVIPHSRSDAAASTTGAPNSAPPRASSGPSPGPGPTSAPSAGPTPMPGPGQQAGASASQSGPVPLPMPMPMPVPVPVLAPVAAVGIVTAASGSGAVAGAGQRASHQAPAPLAQRSMLATPAVPQPVPTATDAATRDTQACEAGPRTAQQAATALAAAAAASKQAATGSGAPAVAGPATATPPSAASTHASSPLSPEASSNSVVAVGSGAAAPAVRPAGAPAAPTQAASPAPPPPPPPPHPQPLESPSARAVALPPGLTGAPALAPVAAPAPAGAAGQAGLAGPHVSHTSNSVVNAVPMAPVPVPVPMAMAMPMQGGMMVMHPMVPGMPTSPLPPAAMGGQPGPHMMPMMAQQQPGYAMMPGPRPAMQPMQPMAMVPPGTPGATMMMSAMVPAGMPGAPRPAGPGGMSHAGMMSMPPAPYLPPGHPMNPMSSAPGSMRAGVMPGHGMPPPMFVYGPGMPGQAPGGMMHAHGGMMHMGPGHVPHEGAGPAWLPGSHAPLPMQGVPVMSHPAQAPMGAGGEGSKSGSGASGGGSGGGSGKLSIGAKPFVPSGMRSPQQQQMHGAGMMGPASYGMHGPSGGAMQQQAMHHGHAQQQQAMGMPMYTQHHQQQMQRQHQQQQQQLMHQHQQHQHQLYQQQQGFAQGPQSQPMRANTTRPASGSTGTAPAGGAGAVGAVSVAAASRNAPPATAIEQQGMDGEGVKQAEPASAHAAQPEANGHVDGSVDTPALPLAESSATGSFQGGEVEQQLQSQECTGSVGGSGDPQEPLLDQSAGSQPSLEAASKPSSSSNATTDEPQEQGSEPHAGVGNPGPPLIAAAISQAGEAEAPSGMPGPSPSAAPSAAPGIAPSTAASEPGVGVPAAPAAAAALSAAAAAAPSLTSASQPQEQLRRSLGAPESSQASLAAATAGGLSNGSSPCMPLSKNGSWSSVLMGDGDAVPDCASPGPASVSGASASGSSSNLAAMAAGVPALGTWKAKLQQNMPPPSQQQQQPSRSSGSGGRAQAPGTSPGMLQQGAKASPQGSQGPHAAQQAPVPMRRAGSRTGASFMLEPAKPSAGKLLCSHDGQFTYAPVGGSGGSGAAAGSESPLQTAPGARLLRLARPLLNRGSQNNCFLNVILQSLWHLACFRQPMLELQLEQHAASKGASPEDQRVMAAIWRIFQAMAQSPTAQEPAQAGAGTTPTPNTSNSVSPQELRDALVGQSSVHIDPSDMQDAGEVFGEVLSILHRADIGAAPGDKVADLQLPARVKVRMADAPAGGVAAPVVVVAEGGEEAAAAPVPVSLVHQVFGLDVQVPCPPSDGDDFSTAGSEYKRSRGAHRKSNGAAAAATAATAAAAAATGAGGVVGASFGAVSASGSAAGTAWQGASAVKRLRDSGVHEVQQFTKFFHLVPAQSLRKAAASMPAASFEEVLAEVEARSQSHSHRAGHKGQQLPGVVLLRRPAVFTLAIVWESPQAPHDAIKGTVEALGCEVELSEVFSMPTQASSSSQAGAPPTTFQLRCVVCYLGHHYLVFALSEEVGQWLQIDDEDVALVGSWGDVCRAMVARRLQPSLLFFEDCTAVRASFSP